MTNLVEEARKRAVDLISRNTTPRGLMAVSSDERTMYETAIYTRDCMIGSLGASLGLGESYKPIFEATLEALGGHQSELGQIPLSVTPRAEGDSVNFESQDSNLWYVIGHCYLHRVYKDKDFFLNSLDSLKSAILWLRYQDSNGNGLLEFPEGCNWMDFFGQRHMVLLDNVMWYGCLKHFGEIPDELGMDGSSYLQMAEDVKQKINLVMWIDNVLEPSKHEQAQKMGMRMGWLYAKMYWEIGGRPYYLPYVEFMNFGEYFDSLGNIMAILLGVTSGEKTDGKDKSDLILNYVRDTACNRPFPIMSIYPPVEPGGKSWRDYYRMGHVIREKSNTPYQYINGGIWPFIGGFYIAALVKAGRMAEAEAELELLAQANLKGYGEDNWGFPEYLHGRSGNVMGGEFFSWSAGMFIYAYECVKSRKVEGFDTRESRQIES